MPSLLPDTFLENTTHLYLPEVRVRARVLYGLVLLGVVLALLACFVVRVDVSFGAGGVLRSVAERTELRALVSGRVQQVGGLENRTVALGDTLLRLSPDLLDERLRLNLFQQAERSLWLTDLRRLTADTSQLLQPGLQLQSTLYAQQYLQLQAQLTENQVRRNKTLKELKADRYLYAEKVIATRELDAKQAEYDQLLEESRLLLARQLSQWQADLTTQQLNLTQLQAEEAQLRQERLLYTVKAPIAGTLQQWSGKYVGSFVQAGELLGILSPDSLLIVECYVKPTDMGLLQPQQTVWLQLDALNYREWGLAQATVEDIAKDFTLMGESQLPVFKVRCRLQTPTLRLKNGYEARLQKGMTLQARFVVARRTLAQLVFDKIDDWLNPNTLNRDR